jgi:nucleoside-diphosphate-sugar epimerase
MNEFSRILVAGGAGFIGSHIADRLLEEDVEVVVLDNLYSGRMENIKQHKDDKRFHFIRGDIRNPEVVKKAVKDVDAVFNEAAVVGIPRSMDDPVLANDVNVGGTLTLLNSCRETGVKRYVQASSASIYGNTKTLPIRETLAPNPVSPYAVAELASENYARVFCTAYGLKTVCLRYFNVYGPRQTSSIYSGIIPIFLDQLLQDKRPTVFGDGKQTRDFVYVEDVVEANMLALTTNNVAGEVFNIATGKPSSVNELVRNLLDKTGKRNLRPLRAPPRKGDVRFSYASIEKARKMLGYEPKYDLEKGVTKLTEWFAENMRR